VWLLGEGKMEKNKMLREMNPKMIIQRLIKAITSIIVLQNRRLPPG
jgi:hypothetical protein